MKLKHFCLLIGVISSISYGSSAKRSCLVSSDTALTIESLRSSHVLSEADVLILREFIRSRVLKHQHSESLESGLSLTRVLRTVVRVQTIERVGRRFRIEYLDADAFQFLYSAEQAEQLSASFYVYIDPVSGKLKIMRPKDLRITPT